IRSLPIHQLKIDRSFVSDIRNRHDDAVIVESIITLAHNLGLSVIAEGVEMADQIIHLKTAGCDEVQGYHISRPVPAEAALALVRQQVIRPL
ncbi:MAG: EAL domain-containing protein, partial [Pigmentiphaga sp.]